METFIKICAGVLLSAVLCLTLSKQEKDMTLLLILAACCMVVSAAVIYLQPVLAFIERLCDTASLNSAFMTVIFKAVGIGLLSEITCLVCSDAGNQALAKTLQILASAVILWISLPLFEELIDLVEEILGTL